MGRIHDVIVVGAGPGGSAAAHYLARRGFDVLLLDNATFPRDKTCGDGLTPRALAVLEDMGLLPALLRDGRRIDGMEVHAPGGQVVDMPVPRPTRMPGHLLIVPRMRLDEAVRQRALASGARFEGGTRVLDMEESPGGITVWASRRQRPVSFHGRMGIVATGASTGLLQRMGVVARRPTMVAARAYFEGLVGLRDRIQIRFDGVPLPGYGWLFPLSATSANVGVGSLAPRGDAPLRPLTSKGAFQGFLRASGLQPMLARARQVGPVKGYPLRCDFATARTFHQRTLLVGEAAGLVNPLTGEGIDYALESGRIAGEHLARMLARGDGSHSSMQRYDRQLRRHFQAMFLLCTWARDWLVHRAPLDCVLGAAARRPVLRKLLAGAAFGDQALLRHTLVSKLIERLAAIGD